MLPLHQTVSELGAPLAKEVVGTYLGWGSSTTTAETFDQLRIENYTSASAGIDSFYPTSSVIREDIHRGSRLVRRACQMLERADEHEWNMDGRSTSVHCCFHNA